MVEQKEIQLGDNVIVARGPRSKLGLMGRVILLNDNQAMLKLARDWYVPVQRNQLEKYIPRCK